MKVLCDHMLGNLATWLRILGVDTVFPSNTVSDDEILKCAQDDGRVLLTRDKMLVARAKKKGIPVVSVTSTSLPDQLRQVLDVVPVDRNEVLSRCTVCNTALVPVPVEEARLHVPEKVAARQQQFWFCPVCRKFYWKGTHYENMEQKIAGLLREPSG